MDAVKGEREKENSVQRCIFFDRTSRAVRELVWGERVAGVKGSNSRV